MQLVLAEHQHGGFKDSVGYDETDATCVGSSDSVDAGAINRLRLGIYRSLGQIEKYLCLG